MLVQSCAFDFSAANKEVKLNLLIPTVMTKSTWMQHGVLQLPTDWEKRAYPTHICHSGLIHAVISSVLKCAQYTQGLINSNHLLLPLENYYAG